jgi:hypothetical protein
MGFLALLAALGNLLPPYAGMDASWSRLNLSTPERIFESNNVYHKAFLA